MSSVYNPKFDAFSDIQLDDSIAMEYCRAYNPISTLAAGSVIEFNVPPANLSFIDLRKTRLKIKVAVKKTTDGSLIDGDCKVTPIVNCLDSIFRSVDLQLQGTDLNAGISVNWGYKNYVDLLLNKTRDYVSSQGVMRGLILDSPGQMETVDPQINQNFLQ